METNGAKNRSNEGSRYEMNAKTSAKINENKNASATLTSVEK